MLTFVLKSIVYAFTVIIFIYLFVSVYLYFSQPGFVYMPSKVVENTPTVIGLKYEEVILTTSDQVLISAWFTPSDQNKGVVLFCHGNAGNLSHRIDSIHLFHKLGFSSLVFDYRGYGRSGGSPSEKGTYLDAECAWKFLLDTKGFSSEEIIVWGRSLGGAVAARLAYEKKARGLIVESSFTSIPDMGVEMYPLLPVRLLARFKYSTLEYVKQVNCPILVVHSPQDEMIPFHHGQKIFEAANPPKKFLQITGSHNEGYLLSPNYLEGIKDFLTLCL